MIVSVLVIGIAGTGSYLYFTGRIVKRSSKVTKFLESPKPSEPAKVPEQTVKPSEIMPPQKTAREVEKPPASYWNQTYVGAGNDFGSSISADLNDGLVAYYLFNGNANDESGNGNNGTVFGATLTSDRFGNANSAYAFDGIDDGIFVSSSSSLTYLNFLRGYTISAWIRPSQKSNAVSDYYSNIVSIAFFSVRLNNLRSVVESTQGRPDGSAAMQSPFSIVFDSNRWYHVVTTWDGSTGNWTVYLDGLAGPTTHSLGGLKPGAIEGPITIGRGSLYDRWFFKGAIDDIRIYNRALSESEVQQLHNSREECAITAPNPQIQFDHKDAEGRIYIPIVNWSAYPDEMFRQAPDLPPCGLNTSSSRTWVDIYTADTNARLYGFCALRSNADLKNIWFMPYTLNGKAYIIIHDRACNRRYRSNIVAW